MAVGRTREVRHIVRLHVNALQGLAGRDFPFADCAIAPGRQNATVGHFDYFAHRTPVSLDGQLFLTGLRVPEPKNAIGIRTDA